MGVRWVPCRVCGAATEGEDSSVVCGYCALDFVARCIWTRTPPVDPEPTPITPEAEARVRRLLDW